MAENIAPISKPTEKQHPFGTWGEEQLKTTGYKVLVYGTSGSGKTYFAASFPKPLFVDMEGGMLSVVKFKPLRLPKNPKRVVKDYSELEKIQTTLEETLAAGNAPFETVVLDSLSEMVELTLKNVLAEFDVNRLYDDQPTQADYGKLNRDFMKLFRSFLRLPCNVVFTNVVAPPKYEDEKLAPSFIGNKIGPEVSRLVDAIGFTFTTASSKEGKDKEAVIKYNISFANTPEHVGKDRLGIGNNVKQNGYEYVFSK